MLSGDTAYALENATMEEALTGADLVEAYVGSEKKADHMMVRTTAYTHTEADHIKYRKMTARGTQLKYGKVRSECRCKETRAL